MPGLDTSDHSGTFQAVHGHTRSDTGGEKNERGGERPLWFGGKVLDEQRRWSTRAQLGVNVGEAKLHANPGLGIPWAGGGLLPLETPCKTVGRWPLSALGDRDNITVTGSPLFYGLSWWLARPPARCSQVYPCPAARLAVLSRKQNACLLSIL